MANRYDVRIRETKLGKYWVVETYSECNCPNCVDDYHWMWCAGLCDLESAKNIANSYGAYEVIAYGNQG